LDGGINLGVSGGSPPYSYTWSNGQSSNDLTQISGGVYYVTITDSEGCQEVDTFQVDSQVNISENSQKHISLYPNPNDGHFNISIEKGKISTVQDAFGRNISFEVLERNAETLEVRLKPVAPGIYYIRINLENDHFETVRFEVF
jgi:hypothetical protein